MTMADTPSGDDVVIVDNLSSRTKELTASANAFARAMATAFSQSVVGGKQLDDVLKSLALRLSTVALTQAFKPVATSLTSGLNSLFSGLFGGGGGQSLAAAMGAIKPF